MNNDLRILGETTRRLPDLAWSSAALISRDLPRDTVLKRINVRLTGSVVTTFGVAPVAYEVSTMDNLAPRLEVTVNGGRTVKAVRPHILHLQQIMTSHVQGERKSSAAAAAAFANNPTADAGFTYGVTTNTTTVAETVTINFEMVLAKTGRQSTWLNLKGTSSAELKIQCGTTADLDKTTNCAFTLPSFNFELTTVEAQDVPAETVFADWRQTFKNIQYSSGQTEAVIDLPKGNFLAGIFLFVIQDASNASAAAAGRRPNNNTLTNLKLRLNGNRIFKSTTFPSLQAELRNKWGVVAPFATNVSRFDGAAYWDLLRDGDLDTAQDCRQPMVDSVDMLVDVRNNDATNNLMPINICLETSEIVRYAK